MTYRGKLIIAIISGLVAFYAFSGNLTGSVIGWLEAQAQQPINDPGAQIRIFESVLQHIDNDYVDEPDLAKVRTGALRGLAGGLGDPQSAYLTAEQVTNFDQESSKSMNLIGAEFTKMRRFLYVVSVVEGSPASVAGLRAGDFVEYLDKQATSDISLYDAKQILLEANGAVNFRVMRFSEKPQTISIVPSSYKIPAPTVEIKNGSIGVIQIQSLDKGQALHVRSKIESLKNRGIAKIVLDLRNLGGGEIAEGVSVANAFIKEGDIAKIIGRGKKVLTEFRAEAGNHIFDGEVAALIDFTTSGAAEVIASALVERKRGEVIGETSFGAGGSQELFKLEGGDGLLLTTSNWASISGKPFFNSKRSDAGVPPTIEIKRSDIPEPIEVEELVDRQQQENDSEIPVSNVPNAAKPAPIKSDLPDLPMEKAIEILSVKSRAAAG